jgi:hypothetical protein
VQDPWALWPYRLKLRLANPELADFTGIAHLRVNLGAEAAADVRDVRFLDDQMREQPWYSRYIDSTGEADFIFQTVPGVKDYWLIFGNPQAQKPQYGVNFPVIGRALIDDRLPPKSHTHGLWLWCDVPAISGSYSHTTPFTDRYGYHGTTEIGNVALDSNTVIRQYVMLDKENPPEQILVRFWFARKPGEGDWEQKPQLIVYWGKGGNIKGLTGSSMRIGDLPPAGSWQSLDIKLGELLRKTGFRGEAFGAQYLYGVDFCTDKGRAWWDLTSIGDVPAETNVVGLGLGPGATKPTFAWQRLRSFKIGKPVRMLSEVQFFAGAADKTSCKWDFGDGATRGPAAPGWGPGNTAEGGCATHVYEGLDAAKVSLAVTPAGGTVQTVSAEVKGLNARSSPLTPAVDLMSCPAIVRSDGLALFKVRAEGETSQAVPIGMDAVLLDARGKELRRDSVATTMLPGSARPTYRMFALDFSPDGLASVRFELKFGGKVLAERAVNVVGSRANLGELQFVGDRYVDKAGSDTVVRLETAAGGEAGFAPRRPALPKKTLVFGEFPVVATPFEQLLKTGMVEAGAQPTFTEVKKFDVEKDPAWCLPFRQAASASRAGLGPDVEAVIVVSPAEMMLAGVPAQTAADAVGVLIDQVRTQSRADVFVLGPPVCSEFEEAGKQYTVALKVLAIEKNVHVIDLYSRASRLAEKHPDVLKTAEVSQGILVHRLRPEMTKELISAIVNDLLGVTSGGE